MSARQRGSSITRVTLKSGSVRWRFRLDLEPGPDGKRRQRTMTYKTEAEAVEAQAKARAAVATQTYTEPSRITVNDWLDSWLSIGERTWRASTTTSYRIVLKPAREAFGRTRLQQLRRADIEALVTRMLKSGGRKGDGRSPRTVALFLTVLTKALNEAVAEGIIATNPAKHVRKPSRPHTEMQTWSAAEMRRFLDVVTDDPLIGAWHLSALGLRRGEVLGLRWRDVDFEGGHIHVRQARVQAGREVVVNEPKTARGRRTIPMHPALAAALKETRRRTVIESPVIPMAQKLQPDRFVVVNEAGEPLRPDRYSDLFEAYTMEADLPHIRLHDLRHTALSLLLEQGVPVPVVARIAGHDPSVTMRTYAHAQDDATRDAVNTLGALYGNRL